MPNDSKIETPEVETAEMANVEPEKASDGCQKKTCKIKEKWTGYSKRKKVTLVSVVALILIVVIGGSIAAGIIFSQPQYPVDLSMVAKPENLLWSDEFEGSTLNTQDWRVADKDGEGKYYDVGGAYHVAEAVSVSDGNLNIGIYYDEAEGRWECGGVHSLYTSAGGRGAFTYGYIEMRAKLADFGGCWSTFWLLAEKFGNKEADKNAAVYGSEIDIVEAPLYDKDRILQAVHIGGWGKNHLSMENPRCRMQRAGKNIYEEFNTYGLYWNKDIYKFYVNGKCMWTTNFYDTVSAVEENINITIGTIGGYNDGLKAWAGGNSLDDNDKTARGTYKIDYVRIYNVYDEAGREIH